MLVYWLGSETFNLWSGVRFPGIAPIYGVISLIGKAFECESKRYGFEFRITPQLSDVAQLKAHSLGKGKVAGLIPAIGTIRSVLVNLV